MALGGDLDQLRSGPDVRVPSFEAEPQFDGYRKSLSTKTSKETLSRQHSFGEAAPFSIGDEEEEEDAPVRYPNGDEPGRTRPRGAEETPNSPAAAVSDRTSHQNLSDKAKGKLPMQFRESAPRPHPTPLDTRPLFSQTRSGFVPTEEWVCISDLLISTA